MDYSPSGIYGLPPATADTLRYGDPRVLAWLQEAVQEGDRLNREDPAWDKADRGMDYIIGEQRGTEHLVPSYVPFAVINKSRKATQAHVSALTDIKPVFGYRAQNSQYQFHADLLNKVVVAWWLESMADLTLGDCIKYAWGWHRRHDARVGSGGPRRPGRPLDHRQGLPRHAADPPE